MLSERYGTGVWVEAQHETELKELVAAVQAAIGGIALPVGTYR